MVGTVGTYQENLYISIGFAFPLYWERAWNGGNKGGKK